MMFRLRVLLACLVAMFFVIVGSHQGLLISASEAATLSGEITAKSKRPPRNLVVYLTRQGDDAVATNPKPVQIHQRDRKFSPSRLVVVQGGAVEFVNDEEQDIDHNVYSLSKGNKFDIGLAARGAGDQVFFTKPGIVKYFCSVHKNMEGTVFVVPSPHFAILKKPGEFEILDVPDGDWVVNVSISHRRYKASPVRVTIAGDTADVVVQLKKKGRK
jgi:plastocyanin